MIGRLLCAMGMHRERLARRFPSPARNTLYGVICARCGAPRVSIGGASPTPPPREGSECDRLWTAQHEAARQWLERRLDGPVPDKFVWWR